MYNFTAQLSGALHFENRFLALAMMGLKRLPCAGTRIRLGACLQMLTYETITVFNMWCGGWEDGGFLSFILSKAIKAYPGDFPKKGKKDPYVISGGHYFLIYQVACVYCCPSRRLCELLSKWHLFNKIIHLLPTATQRQRRFRNNEYTFCASAISH